MLGYGFDLSFDSSILSYLGETPGTLFTDLSANPGIMAQVAGIANAILLAPSDFVEPLNLAVLHVGITGLGLTSISITGDPSHLDQGLIYLSGSDDICICVLDRHAGTQCCMVAGLRGAGDMEIFLNWRRDSRLSN